MDVRDLKRSFQWVQSRQSLGYDEEIEVSYVPLLKGEKVAVLLTERPCDIDIVRRLKRLKTSMIASSQFTHHTIHQF